MTEGDTPIPPFDGSRILATFRRHHVKFILIGGYAAGGYGASRATNDVDIVPEWSHENLEHLVEAMRELGAGLRILGGDVISTPIHVELLLRTEISTWTCSYGDFDMMRRLPDGAAGLDYPALLTRTTRLTFPDGSDYLAASLNDIITSKEHAGRPKDQEALPELYELRDRLGASE